MGFLDIPKINWPRPTPVKPPPRRRGPGKKTLAKLAAQQSPQVDQVISVKESISMTQMKRAYKEVVGIGGINSDWALSGISEDSDVWQNIFALRSRSRDLFRTDVYFKKYKEELWANVFGAEGITCRLEIKETEDRVLYSPDEQKFYKTYWKRRQRLGEYLERTRGIPNQFDLRGIDLDRKATIQVGDMDIYANKVIEEGWRDWKRREYCTVAQCFDYNQVCQIRLLSAARDGDFFIRHVRSPAVNKYGYSLQLINSEWCDFQLNSINPDTKNMIRMGIERDSMGKRIAYYFIKRQPQDWQFSVPGAAMTSAPKSYERILAEDIIHYSRYEDGDSTRPAPWSASVIQKSRHLDKYEEAEVVAARVSACKLGFFTSNMVPEGGEAMSDRPDPTQEGTMDAEPGSFTGLKWGIDFKEWNPSHPNGNFDLFRKGLLRAWCAGLPGANYNIIANDLEGVNYSSGRLGMLDERELWKLIQKFDIEIAERPIFEAWLYMALLTGAIPLPLAKFDKFNKPIFRGRRWAWVDPLKEVQSSALEVANKFTSRTRIIEDSDVDADFEQVLFELAEEEMMMAALGMDSTPVVGKVSPTKPAEDTADTENTAGEAQPGQSSDGTSKALTMTEFRELIEATKPHPPASMPPITVNIPERQMVVNVPERQVSVNVPEAKPPIIKVAAAQIRIPEIKPPDVIVNVAPSPAPNVEVTNEVQMPSTKKVSVEKDADGKVKGFTVSQE